MSRLRLRIVSSCHVLESYHGVLLSCLNVVSSFPKLLTHVRIRVCGLSSGSETFQGPRSLVKLFPNIPRR